MKNFGKQLLSYGIIVVMALLLAVNYYFFIIGNDFAPAGLNGIATMIQYKTGFSISYFSLIVNIPLCVFAFFCITREYGLKSLLFTLVYSGFYLFLQHHGPTMLQYDAGGHDTIFPAIISGVISGVVAGLCFKYNSASGGIELISRYIHKVRPDANFFVVTFSINTVVACLSLVVYSDTGVVDYKPVALCITYCFVSNFVGNQIIKGSKTAYKFTIITTYPTEIANEVMQLLRHGVTKLEAEGAYTGDSKSVLLCVVNKHQLTNFKALLDKYDRTFFFYELVNETSRNFKYIKN